MRPTSSTNQNWPIAKIFDYWCFPSDLVWGLLLDQKQNRMSWKCQCSFFFFTYQPDQPELNKSENLCFSSDLEEIWYGGYYWAKNSIEWVSNDWQKPINSKNLHFVFFIRYTDNPRPAHLAFYVKICKKTPNDYHRNKKIQTFCFIACPRSIEISKSSWLIESS